MVKEHISRNAVATVEESYANNVTDEFIDPITIIDSNDKPMATIEEGDVVTFNLTGEEN
jgi:2,3-bisphosphoglycerate-independent phosphoglycerate mutase